MVQRKHHNIKAERAGRSCGGQAGGRSFSLSLCKLLINMGPLTTGGGSDVA